MPQLTYTGSYTSSRFTTIAPVDRPPVPKEGLSLIQPYSTASRQRGIESLRKPVTANARQLPPTTINYYRRLCTGAQLWLKRDDEDTSTTTSSCSGMSEERSNDQRHYPEYKSMLRVDDDRELRAG
ncbi:hypothetical protein JCM1840_005511 [Sporobolomyces johnsonii]